jgi:tRNA-2-methylthio-N6-dimethylallyladenosine synthase
LYHKGGEKESQRLGRVDCIVIANEVKQSLTCRGDCHGPPNGWRGLAMTGRAVIRLFRHSSCKIVAMKRYYLWTIGCQMNDADAARVSGGLMEMGLCPTADVREADLAVLITCVVRQSAEDKVVGRLASLKGLKRERPGVRIAVMGCFVDPEATLQDRFPHVDAFFRPSDIAGLLQFAGGQLGSAKQAAPSGQPSPAVCAYVPISYGCDHHCTYCIVRLRRGGQQSRPPADILAEAGRLVQDGAREITLLGQNVDAYGQDLGTVDLADLLVTLHEMDGLWRIRFLTSHPAHMNAKLIRTVGRLPRVCPHFELPVQAGDDDILRRMGRGYTVHHYRQLVAAIREGVPGCSIATDVIVGFPGESEAQFQATHDLMAEMRFDSVHIAKYSPRPGTPAARLSDDVPAAEKERRRVLLEELQTHIASEIHGALLGQTVEILVEERQRGRWKGRTVTNKLVFFDDPGDRRGHLLQVRITRAGAWSLRGDWVKS